MDFILIRIVMLVIVITKEQWKKFVTKTIHRVSVKKDLQEQDVIVAKKDGLITLTVSHVSVLTLVLIPQFAIPMTVSVLVSTTSGEDNVSNVLRDTLNTQVAKLVIVTLWAAEV